MRPASGVCGQGASLANRCWRRRLTYARLHSTANVPEFFRS
jgi:hypothetical protein